MDAKALAKSKRAHSQHHSKKSHSGHKPKVPSVSSESVRNLKNLQGTHAAADNAKNPSQSRRVSALPSNWDRYNEEFDFGMESTSGNISTDQHNDATIPKSKGADYRHLIAEAEAEAESQSKLNTVSDGLVSLDDVFQDEFSRSIGSMLSARVDGILSWIEDDNFIVEDRSSSSLEPASLSLNLNALAEKLETVDLHEALYIESDILLPELSQTTQAVTTTLNESVERDFNGDDNDKSERLELIDPIDNLEDNQAAACCTKAEDQVKDAPITICEPENSSNGLLNVKPSAMETELDMLLDSLDEIGIQETQNKPCTVGSTNEEFTPEVLDKVFTEAAIQSLLSSLDSNPSAPMIQRLDDLLLQTSDSETSDSEEPQWNQTTSSSSVGKSKVLDEFDSWLDTI